MLPHSVSVDLLVTQQGFELAGRVEVLLYFSRFSISVAQTNFVENRPSQAFCAYTSSTGTTLQRSNSTLSFLFFILGIGTSGGFGCVSPGS